MKRAAGLCAIIVAVLAFLAVNGYALLAYFVKSWSKDHTQIYDGLGRSLDPAPWLAQFYLGTDGMWAGFGWHVADLAIYFGGIFLAWTLFGWGSAARETPKSS